MDNGLAWLHDETQLITHRLGDAAPAYQNALESLLSYDTVKRVWARDGTLWSEAPVTVADVENRLGWLDLPVDMRIETTRLVALAEEVKAAHLTRIVLLGMGGSSLAPEVLGNILAPGEGGALTVLDSTDPAQISHAVSDDELPGTLFLVASKSGTTAETMALYAYFRHRLEQIVGPLWASHMIAITDPGTALANLAHAQGFRAVYANPPDIGGRYSALSLFGLVPGALLGIDIDRLLRSGKAMADQCRWRKASENPGLVLGAILGGLARDPGGRRNKLTLLTSPELRPFGPWVEQLIAESTGKENTGIVPVVDEPPQEPSLYGVDRQFVYMRLEEGENSETDSWAAQLVKAGQPVAVLPLTSLYDIGAAFFLWEFATAIAGLLLDLNPFDQPNVESAKKQAHRALESFESERELPHQEPVLQEDGLSVFGPSLEAESLVTYLRSWLRAAEPGYYATLMAYMERSPAHATQLSDIAQLLSQRLRVPVTLGFGPRFLHSTGQLHKGGPKEVLGLQITRQDADDLSIPEASYTFGILKQAQALGDMTAWQDAGRSIVRVDLGVDAASGLTQLHTLLADALAPREA